MSESSETPNVSDKDLVGNSIVLQPEKRYLLGKSDAPIEGYEICQLEELANNRKVSRYAVGFNLNGDHVIISRPKLILANGREYASTNRIFVTDKERGEFEVEGAYDAGVGGGNLEKVFIGDKQKENGFSLIIEEGNKVVLQSTITNGQVS
jgi:hypothetical protein